MAVPRPSSPPLPGRRELARGERTALRGELRAGDVAVLAEVVRHEGGEHRDARAAAEAGQERDLDVGLAGGPRFVG
jgi:hypothetical protein